MNYRHQFHAGNCADVVKHSLLILLLESLQKKEKGFCYIDTHAGRGVYDLNSEEAKKTEEYKMGVEKLFGKCKNPVLMQYNKIISELNSTQNSNIYPDSDNRRVTGNLYPGSPWIALKMQRPQDQMILNELHPEEFKMLKHYFRGEKNSAIHQRNAYEFLPAIIPPELRRGLVLIDPPFEKNDELTQIKNVLQKSFERWPQGIYFIWLPLKEKSLDSFYRDLDKLNCERKFFLETNWEAPIDKPDALKGSAYLILNLPWNLESDIQSLMGELNTLLKLKSSIR